LASISNIRSQVPFPSQLSFAAVDGRCMTAPRMCIPGATYLVTRTVINRLFLLNPSAVVNNVFGYCLGRAAKMFGVQVHAACVESTHFHLVVTDMQGRLSDFMHWLDRHVARCLIEHYASTHPMHHLDGIWTKSPFSATLLVNREAILGAIVYTLVNPQKDGLVADYRDWPGFHTRPSCWLERPREFQKPSLYFSASNPEHYR
jgi:REP element-mobilizing transposase RayT